ncbi:MAG: aspartate--ammonia ligase [Gemmatimonadales bacterium]|nr:aspartate--ammonia ligase [Gemmatimonadales bacterium]
MSVRLFIPQNYKPLLNPRDTEPAIRAIKEFFQTNLAFELNLTRVTAPLFVKGGTGINDDLNSVEKPAWFTAEGLRGTRLEMVQSLAKWKRLTLAELGFEPGEGLYTDMNAIRPSETLDNTHSLYVDQWDWERVIAREERNVGFLKWIVRRIYDVIRRTERYVCFHYPVIEPVLPDEITFLHSEDLQRQYPELAPPQRETEACREHGAVFVRGIGAPLADGEPHDGRAPDYDDWVSLGDDQRKGLNGDIIVHNPLLDSAFELSSMGIRVDAESLLQQLAIRQCEEWKELYFHTRLLAGELPLSIGGGIGQSRLCMFYLRKAHIGEIQASVWPDDMSDHCRQNNIFLL